MFVALKEFPLDGGRVVLKGQPVPEAETWQYSVLKSLIDMGWIKKTDECASATESRKPESKKASKRGR